MKLISKSLPLVFIFFFSWQLSGQEKKGAINQAELHRFREDHNSREAVAAIRNAITHNDIKKLSQNRQNDGSVDKYFTYKVEIAGITDQKSSGRCWLFTSLNVLRPLITEKYNLADFQFSHTYSFFWDQLEKANLFLMGIINTADKPMDDRTVEWLFRHPISDGGVWSSFVNVAEKYGVVPLEAMPEAYSAENTAMMRKMLRMKLKEDGLALREKYAEGSTTDELLELRSNMLSEIYHMLSIMLGEPPEEFTWRYQDEEETISPVKTYTPLSFYDEVVGVDLNEYILFMDDPTRPYERLYEIEFDRNLYEGVNWKYINLPAGMFKPFAIESLKEGNAMYFSCDVGKQLNKDKGILDVDNYDYSSLMGVDFGMDKKQRIMTFESGSSHGMSLAGVDINSNGKPVKWLLENSWGKKSGQEGFLFMTDEWFDEYMFRLVIHKKYVPEEILKILEQKPTMLPPWDPMFSMEE